MDDNEYFGSYLHNSDVNEQKEYERDIEKPLLKPSAFVKNENHISSSGYDFFDSSL